MYSLNIEHKHFISIINYVLNKLNLISYSPILILISVWYPKLETTSVLLTRTFQQKNALIHCTFRLSPIRVINSFLPEYQIPTDTPHSIPKKTRDTPELTLVLDLDETLVHSSAVPINKDDIQVPINDSMGDSIVNFI